MFTGLIETMGTLLSWQTRGRVVRLGIRTPLARDLAIGSSIAIDGVCQTVVHTAGDTFDVEATGETLKRTTLASWRGPRAVNLERPLRADGRLDGHLVTGHVDGIVRLMDRRMESAGVWCVFSQCPDLRRYVAPQGSVALDGVSLTVATASEGSFSVSLIPHTLGQSTLGARRPGDYLNLEVDLVARYVERLIARASGLGSQEGMNEWF
ncbi:riboflavin synthase [Candidatus Fermentibacteria bacterium]|nr:riboflavin synthase [Candidatus Fermentibacteria bacterium]